MAAREGFRNGASAKEESGIAAAPSDQPGAY
jgi:hypothetical protein